MEEREGRNQMSLPKQWAFAKDRYEGLLTARERIGGKLRSLPPNEKSVFLNGEIAEGVNVYKGPIRWLKTTGWDHGTL